MIELTVGKIAQSMSQKSTVSCNVPVGTSFILSHSIWKMWDISSLHTHVPLISLMICLLHLYKNQIKYCRSWENFAKSIFFKEKCRSKVFGWIDTPIYHLIDPLSVFIAIWCHKKYKDYYLTILVEKLFSLQTVLPFEMDI